MGSVLRVFSYLPNPRVWKSVIAANIGGVEIEIIGDKPKNLSSWLWDYNARKLSEEEMTQDSPHLRKGKRGFEGALYKTEEFLKSQPFGTVPAAYSPDGEIVEITYSKIRQRCIYAKKIHSQNIAKMYICYHIYMKLLKFSK